MIKYLGSKRRLIPVLKDLFRRSGASTGLDLFTGTTRVAQAMKQSGMLVTAVDTARYSEVFSKCWIETNANSVILTELDDAIKHLMSLPGYSGYFTETFCIKSRYFQPHNGMRIDAIRDMIESDYRDSYLYDILLTSLILAADRVDSTVAVQMAFLKSWSARSHNPLQLRLPMLLPGNGISIRGDATEVSRKLGHFDLVYLDPPYNQHRYYCNYHIYETMVAWDCPEHYGIACKRIDCRDDATKSAFNRKRDMPIALRSTIENLDSRIIILSYNNESWLSLDELCELFPKYETVIPLAFESNRYVGAKIGVFNPKGRRVGKVSHLKNREYLIVAGPRAEVEHLAASYLNMAQQADSIGEQQALRML